MQAAPSPQHVLEIVLMSITGILLTTTGFFLKQTWNEIKEVKGKVDDHGNRIVRLETINEVSS